MLDTQAHFPYIPSRKKQVLIKRSRIGVPTSFNEKEIEAEALKEEKVQRLIGEKTAKRVIVAYNNLVNVVV